MHLKRLWKSECVSCIFYLGSVVAVFFYFVGKKNSVLQAFFFCFGSKKNIYSHILWNWICIHDVYLSHTMFHVQLTARDVIERKRETLSRTQWIIVTYEFYFFLFRYADLVLSACKYRQTRRHKSAFALVRSHSFAWLCGERVNQILIYSY